MNGLLARGLIILAVVLTCAVGLVALLGLLVAADYFAFATILSPPLAALAAAGTALLFCVVAIFVGKLALAAVRKRSRKNVHRRIAEILGEVFGKEIVDFADKHPTRSIAAALFAGFALGFSPKLRSAMRAFLRR
jgi:hypothetical protein